jgi:hypothetical protein
MRFGLKLIESNSQIQKDILNAILPTATSHFIDAVMYIKQNLPGVVRMAIINSLEYGPLVGGTLREEFGIPDASQKIDGLLDIWTNNIHYEYSAPKITGTKITANFSASMIRIDFSDVLYSSYAEVQDYARGYSLPWLQWLLLEGNKVIVPSHSVSYGTNSRSRTGNAVMVRSRSNWKVPAEYAGTINDNWITRALDSADVEINQVLEKAFS